MLDNSGWRFPTFCSECSEAPAPPVRAEAYDPNRKCSVCRERYTGLGSGGVQRDVCGECGA